MVFYVVTLNQPSVSRSFWDIKLQGHWDRDLDLSGSRDISGYVTIGLAICGFLLVVGMNWPCISNCCWYIEFPIGGPLKPSLYLASLLRQYVPNGQPYFHWKCIDPHFCFRGKVRGHTILQLCACVCSRYLDTSFELLTATIGPQTSLLRYLDLPIENALRGWKIGAKLGKGSPDFDP